MPAPPAWVKALFAATVELKSVSALAMESVRRGGYADLAMLLDGADLSSVKRRPRYQRQ